MHTWQAIIGKIIIMDKNDYIERLKSTIKEMNVKRVSKCSLQILTSTVKELIKGKIWLENTMPKIKKKSCS